MQWTCRWLQPDVYFSRKRQFIEAHDVDLHRRRCLCRLERTTAPSSDPQHYFKSQQEMVTLFADLPEAIANTVEIAKLRVQGLHPRSILPKFADNEID
jgi:DNA polymerase-3 subunit alpha